MKIKKTLTALFSLAFVATMPAITASAETIQQDGLTISLTADKAQGDEIQARVSVTNTNSEPVYQVQLENLIPGGYTIAASSDKTKYLYELKAGETVELNSNFVKNVSANPGQSSAGYIRTNHTFSPALNPPSPSPVPVSNVTPSSGNNSSGDSTAKVANTSTASSPTTGSTGVIPYVVAALGSAVLIIVTRKGKGKQLLSIFLCGSMLLATIPITDFRVDAVGDKTANITVNVNAGGETVAVNASVSYMLVEPDKKFDEDHVGEIYYSPVDPEHIAVSDDGFTMYADNEVLVVSKPGVSKIEIMNLAKSYGAEVVGYIEQTGDYQWKFSNVKTQDEFNKIVSELLTDNLVEDAYLNYIDEMTESAVSHDIQLGSQWSGNMVSLNELSNENANNNEGRSWGVEAIHAPEAWKFMNEHKSEINPVRVGLIDAGFDETHDDLSFAKNGVFYNDVAQNGLNQEKANQISREHGTHVAGTMAANGINSDGINGIYPYSTSENRLLYGVSRGGTLQIKENGAYDVSVMHEKIDLAELVLRNVKVINHSINNRRSRVKQIVNHENKWESALEELEKNAVIEADFINRLLNLGCDFVIVCAAGNDPDGNEINEGWESKYNSFLNAIENKKVQNRIIVVGSVGRNYALSSFSFTGSRVDIFAPGEDIYSTVPTGNQYNVKSGTSMASPHVAGVCANVWSMNNNLTGEQVKDIVINSVIASDECPLKDNVNEENYTDILFEEGYRGIYKYPVVNCEAAVRIAARTKGEGNNRQAHYGAALGWVVEQKPDGSAAKDDNVKVVEATVRAYTDDATHRLVEETTTDAFGHYELMLEPGKYVIEATKTGYDRNEQRNNVHVEMYANQVFYLKWIELIKLSNSSESTTEPDSENNSNIEDLLDNSEKKLKELVETASKGIIAEWSYCDYDGDGKKEAYAIIGNKDTHELNSIWYVSSDGNAKLMRDQFTETGKTYSYTDNSDKLVDGRRVFIVNEASGNYDMPSYIFGVNNGKPIEYSVSGNYADFKFYQITQSNTSTDRTADSHHVTAFSSYYSASTIVAPDVKPVQITTNDYELHAIEYTHETGSLTAKEYLLGFDEAGDLYVVHEIKQDSNDANEIAWKAAYTDYIDKYISKNSDYTREHARFYFLDINGDSIPEIHIQSGSGAGGSTMITYNSGYDTVSELIKGNSSGVRYEVGKNIFDYEGGHMDSYHNHVYMIENGSFVLVAEGDFGAEDNSHIELDVNGDPIYKYFWNNIEVSKNQYNTNLNELIDPDHAMCYSDITTEYSYPEIKERITNYK